jgi:hypothetical protein
MSSDAAAAYFRNRIDCGLVAAALRAAAERATLCWRGDPPPIWN